MIWKKPSPFHISIIFLQVTTRMVEITTSFQEWRNWKFVNFEGWTRIKFVLVL